ncbi:MAG: pantoate--beta-alanine ligase [Pelagibacteraceae bacterium TMED232]|nr:MAG: pantoate--beta-alanine ligase [Pelagibacteraceae bacterium TMED232]
MFYLLYYLIQMKILFNKNDLNEALNNVSNLGFVPTMGSLHKGHVSLIKKSIKDCSKTIVSIYVNPKQFNNKNDFDNYPRNNKKDLLILKKLKVNYVYLPRTQDIYDSYKINKIKISKKDQILCANFRRGHFEGVIDVMNRLTKIIKPKKIFMGEKDFQQLFLVRKFISKKNHCKIIECKTIRNSGKVALSSRNLLLKNHELIKASKIAQNLILFKKIIDNQKEIGNLIKLKKHELIKLFNIKIEYLELRNKLNLKLSKKGLNSKIFFAYYINRIRLIDNF